MPKYHAVSHARVSEAEAFTRLIGMAALIDQPIMIFHVSTAEGAKVIRDSRGQGLKVFAETCPQYLFLTANDLDKPGAEGAKWMCSPPPRTHSDQEALWQALSLGDLQTISSDHAPYRYDETGKLRAGPNPNFKQVANGLPGLELRLPLLFDAMVSKGRLGLEKFVELTSTAPAKIYNLHPRKGSIAVGADADIAIWDPNRETVIADEMMHDLAGYTPFAGRKLKGWPVSRALARPGDHRRQQVPRGAPAAENSWRAAAARRQSRRGGSSPTWIRSGILGRSCCDGGSRAMKIVIFGGTGFVGLNLAEVLLARGHDVTLYDRAQLPPSARRSLADYGARLKAVQGDITDADAIDALIAAGCDAIVLGAAVTAGDELERASTSRVLEINVMAQIPILHAAIRHGVRRVVNLSSASAYGACGRSGSRFWTRKRPAIPSRSTPSASSPRSDLWRAMPNSLAAISSVCV